MSGRKAPSSSLSDNPLFKTKLCKHWTTSDHKFCPHSTRCVFAHGEHELRSIGSRSDPNQPSQAQGATGALHQAGGDSSRALRGRQAAPPEPLAGQEDSMWQPPPHPSTIMAAGGAMSAAAGMPPGVSPLTQDPSLAWGGMPPGQESMSPHAMLAAMYGSNMQHAAAVLAHSWMGGGMPPPHPGHPTRSPVTAAPAPSWSMPGPGPGPYMPGPGVSPMVGGGSPPGGGGGDQQAAALRILSDFNVMSLPNVTAVLRQLAAEQPELLRAVQDAASKLGQPLPALSSTGGPSPAALPPPPSAASSGSEDKDSPPGDVAGAQSAPQEGGLGSAGGLEGDGGLGGVGLFGGGGMWGVGGGFSPLWHSTPPMEPTGGEAGHGHPSALEGLYPVASAQGDAWAPSALSQ